MERLAVFAIQVSLILAIILFAIYVFVGQPTRLPVFNLLTVALMGK